MKTTTATKKNNTAIKKRKQQLLQKIHKYENNMTEAIAHITEEGALTLSCMLYVALFPQLKNHLNINDYKQYHLLTQTDADFREKVYAGERPYTNIEEDVFHYDLMPMLYQQLTEAVREVIISGATRKFCKTISKIEEAVKGVELCDNP